MTPESATLGYIAARLTADGQSDAAAAVRACANRVSAMEIELRRLTRTMDAIVQEAREQAGIDARMRRVVSMREWVKIAPASGAGL